jgi:hypothetical protein
MIWTGAAAVITEEATAARRRRRSRKAEDVWMDVGRKSERQREMVGLNSRLHTVSPGKAQFETAQPGQRACPSPPSPEPAALTKGSASPHLLPRRLRPGQPVVDLSGMGEWPTLIAGANGRIPVCVRLLASFPRFRRLN